MPLPSSKLSQDGLSSGLRLALTGPLSSPLEDMPNDLLRAGMGGYFQLGDHFVVAPASNPAALADVRAFAIFPHHRHINTRGTRIGQVLRRSKQPVALRRPRWPGIAQRPLGQGIIAFEAGLPIVRHGYSSDGIQSKALSASPWWALTR